MLIFNFAIDKHHSIINNPKTNNKMKHYLLKTVAVIFAVLVIFGALYLLFEAVKGVF